MSLEGKLEEIEIYAKALVNKDPFRIGNSYLDFRFSNKDFQITHARYTLKDELPSQEKKVFDKITIKYRLKDGRFFDVVYVSNERCLWGDWIEELAKLYHKTFSTLLTNPNDGSMEPR